MKKRISNIITAATFCALVGSITVASMLNPVKTYSATEKRPLAQAPEFSFDALFSGSYTEDYEKFITDQFVMRDGWITLKTYTELALGKKEAGERKDEDGKIKTKGVFFGSDGYFFEKHFISDERTVNQNVNTLKSFVKRVKNKYNTAVLIAPTASLILEDKLPLFAPVWDQASLLDRLSEEIPGFVDCRDVLNSHKDEQLYYHADHHWTTDGAYYAYTELCRELGLEPYPKAHFEPIILADDFTGTLAAKVNLSSEKDVLFSYDPGVIVKVENSVDLDPVTLAVTEWKETDSIYVESFLSGSDKYSVFFGGNLPMTKITTNVSNGKTLFVIKDSYSHCMIPMLSAHYETLIVVDFRSINVGAMSLMATTLGAHEGIRVDDIAVIYNAENFTEDRNISKLLG